MTIMEKEILEQPKALASLRQVNAAAIKSLVAEIKQRNNIELVYFAARGTSDHASIYASYLLGTYVGIPCALATPSVVTAYQGKLNLSKALVVGVSQSGKAADSLAVLERAKENGAITVAVTNDPDSPMAKFASYHLFCNTGAEISVAATKTYTAQMYLLALLAAEWSQNAAFASSLAKIPAAMEELLAYLPSKIDAVIQRYRYMTDGFILARGFNYPVALEGALKLQETNYVRMKGYAISDFHHGPIAQVENGTPVIVYAAQGELLKDCAEMIGKLDQIGAEVILVTDSDELAEGRNLTFQIPKLHDDSVTIFLFAAFAQLFACKLTAVKGLNPDAPRNLKKVTITK